MVHGDIFRAPEHPMLFSAAIGTGTQVRLHSVYESFTLRFRTHMLFRFLWWRSLFSLLQSSGLSTQVAVAHSTSAQYFYMQSLQVCTFDINEPHQICFCNFQFKIFCRSRRLRCLAPLLTARRFKMGFPRRNDCFNVRWTFLLCVCDL